VISVISHWVILAQITSDQIRVPKGDLTDRSFTSGLRIAFGIAGGIALALIAYGGLKYVLSQGNPQETAKAKNTIIDALIGLAVIIFSFAIVGFAVSRLR